MFFNSVKLSKEYDIPKLFPILYKIMSFFALRQIKRPKIQMDFRPYFVHPMRIKGKKAREKSIKEKEEYTPNLCF